MDALTVARGYALGRAALGAGLVAAPGLLGRPWVGPAADDAGGQVALRGLGVRDLVLGGISLHVVTNPQAGPRWMAMCAAADAVDLGATIAARRRLPASALGVAALAAAGAATGIGLYAKLRH
jgi:hypothetical protein